MNYFLSNNLHQGHTRIIYQLQLLEAINNEIIDGNNEKLEPLTINIEDGMITRSGKIILYNTE